MSTKLSLSNHHLSSLITMVIVIALVISSSVHFYVPTPGPSTIPTPSKMTPLPVGKAQASPIKSTKPPDNPSTLPSLQSSSPILAAEPAKNQLVRFITESARLEFLTVNKISPSDLIALPDLNLYKLLTADIVATPGSTVFNDHTYQALLTPTDPQFSSQWYLPRINAPTAWNHQTGSAETTIAIIDTGFALNHVDLVTKWAINMGEQGPSEIEAGAPNCTSLGLPLDKSCNNYDDDGDGFVDNFNGWNFINDTNSTQAGQSSPNSSSVTHGSLVAGIIGASTNNSLGVSGVSWANRLMPIQALSDAGSGTTVSVSLAIHYAVDHGARIINLSLGSLVNDPIMQEQINYALAHNVSVIAAAGNDGCDCILYPARYPGVISVGAVGSDNTKASFSSYGTALSLVAPGTNSICTTAWSKANQTNAYSCSYSGTSFSAPMVAGAAGLLLSQNTTLSPSAMQSALTSSATKLSAMNGQNRTNSYGYGLLNIYGALGQVHCPALKLARLILMS